MEGKADEGEWMGKWKERMSRPGWGDEWEWGEWLLGWLHELGDRMEGIFFFLFLVPNKNRAAEPLAMSPASILNSILKKSWLLCPQPRAGAGTATN